MRSRWNLRDREQLRSAEMAKIPGIAVDVQVHQAHRWARPPRGCRSHPGRSELDSPNRTSRRQRPGLAEFERQAAPNFGVNPANGVNYQVAVSNARLSDRFDDYAVNTPLVAPSPAAGRNCSGNSLRQSAAQRIAGNCEPLRCPTGLRRFRRRSELRDLAGVQGHRKDDRLVPARSYPAEHSIRVVARCRA